MLPPVASDNASLTSTGAGSSAATRSSAPPSTGNLYAANQNPFGAPSFQQNSSGHLARLPFSGTLVGQATNNTGQTQSHTSGPPPGQGLFGSVGTSNLDSANRTAPQMTSASSQAQPSRSGLFGGPPPSLFGPGSSVNSLNPEGSSSGRGGGLFGDGRPLTSLNPEGGSSGRAGGLFGPSSAGVNSGTTGASEPYDFLQAVRNKLNNPRPTSSSTTAGLNSGTTGASEPYDLLQAVRNRLNNPQPTPSSTTTGFNSGATNSSHHASSPLQTGSVTGPLSSRMATRLSRHLPNAATGDLFHRVHDLRERVEEIDQQMESDILPSVETLSDLRFLQYLYVAEAHRDPTSMASVGPSIFYREIEFLEGRITRLFERHEEWTRHLLRRPLFSVNDPPTPVQDPPPMYLARSPEGNQGLVVSLGSAMPASDGGHSALPPLEPTRTVPFTGPNANLAPAPGGARPNQADVQNVVHQAVVNQQRRQNEAANGGAGGHFRRIWLFVRLYFFIYMISESGTWTRIIFVTAAVLISLLSDSDLPHQALRMLINPMQRHLERLAVVDDPTEQPAARPRAVIGDVFDYLWRAERSIVLLLASLVPGIGERQVQARSTAEAEAEQRRVEEERRQSEEQNQPEGQDIPEGQQGESQAQPQPQATGETQPRAPHS